MSAWGESMIGGVLRKLRHLQEYENAEAERDRLCRMVAALGLDTAPPPVASPIERVDVPALFVVWIDLNFGGEFGPAEWVENSEPQPLADALAEAREARLAWLTGGSRWIVKVEPA